MLPHAFITGPNGVGMTDRAGVEVPVTPLVSMTPGKWWGDSTRAGVAYHAFITAPIVGMTDLGTLGGSHSYAYGIDDAGQVERKSDTATGCLTMPLSPAPMAQRHDRLRNSFLGESAGRGCC